MSDTEPLWSQIHWFNRTGGGTYETCSMYWEYGLSCRWCGREPLGYGITTITWRGNELHAVSDVR